jgi:hypothetical protein
VIEAVIGAGLGVSILGLAAWLVHTTVSAVRGEARATIHAAELGADLRIADANAETWRRTAQRQARRAAAYQEINDALRRNPVLPAGAGLAGIDVLSAALDFAADLEPDVPTGRRGGAGGGLPDPAVPAAAEGDAGGGGDDPVSVPRP